jgi:cell division septation protein DedD
MLDDVEDTKWQKWVLSLQKLHAGDKVMLVRIKPESSSDRRRNNATIPAPIDVQERARSAASRQVLDAKTSAAQSKAVNEPVQAEAYIKREANTSASVPRKSSHTTAAKHNSDDLAVTTTALRQLSTEEPDPKPTTKSTPLGANGASHGRLSSVKVSASSITVALSN